jgi:hypothetical protein
MKANWDKYDETLDVVALGLLVVASVAAALLVLIW